jgi:large subunit ribosomal protein L15
MVINKRSKNSRQRGNLTHGWGAMKKHRGKGNKGGAGMAGTGKRGDAKKPSIWKNPKYFGKYGFKKKNTAPIKAVNLSYFEEKLDKLVAKKLIQQEGDNYIIDVQKIGFNKVLGYGKLTKKFKITSPRFSKDAVKKIKAAGGEVIQTEKEATPAEEASSTQTNESKSDSTPKAEPSKAEESDSAQEEQ